MVVFVFGTRRCVFFVFKQKTAYEMRISDWSSDVCSSDRVSSSAPNLLCARRSRAIRPSIPSSTPATMIIVIAAAQSPSIAKRTPVSPEQSASKVIALGAKARNGIPPMRAEEHTSELQPLMRLSYAGFYVQKKKHIYTHTLVKK